MHLFKKYFKFNDSWMWCDWVAHDGFGRPRLKINQTKQRWYFYFYFSCYKLQWYWVKPKWKRQPVAGAENIEYIRKDAFIEKAERYIRSVADGLDRDDDVEAFISEFKKYMEGE